MTQERIRMLTQLKERVQKQGVIRGAYIEQKADGSCQFCAVGHLMDIAGIDRQQIILNINDDNVDTLSGFYLNPLTSAGIKDEELQLLQEINDDNTIGKDEIVEYITKLIEKNDEVENAITKEEE